jgi:2-oxoglutarate dehydrogenase E1 component
VVSLSINGENSNGENDFGANDWLVEEMYDQYKVNPDSVDKEWWPILERYHQAQGSTPATATTPPPAAPVAAAPAAPVAPAAPAAAPMVAKTTRIEPKAQPIPAQAPVTESITTIEAAEEEALEDQINVLKGMSKALASNMDASIKVPTATSVRTIPAKLLIDNRIVINSHLSRTRGGKVSFTHILASHLFVHSKNSQARMFTTPRSMASHLRLRQRTSTSVWQSTSLSQTELAHF